MTNDKLRETNCKLFARVRAELIDDQGQHPRMWEFALEKVCGLVETLEAKIDRLEDLQRNGYDGQTREEWRAEADVGIAADEAEFVEKGRKAIGIETGTLTMPNLRQDRTLPDLHFTATLGKVPTSAAAVEVLRRRIHESVYAALSTGGNKIPYTDQGLAFVKEQTAKCLREQFDAQDVKVWVDEAADMPVLTKVGVHVNKAPEPKQVFACSRCNTPNEYQDGPFTCHNCRFGYKT